jgi:hypothetical protein
MNDVTTSNDSLLLTDPQLLKKFNAQKFNSHVKSKIFIDSLFLKRYTEFTNRTEKQICSKYIRAWPTKITD